MKIFALLWHTFAMFDFLSERVRYREVISVLVYVYKCQFRDAQSICWSSFVTQELSVFC